MSADAIANFRQKERIETYRKLEMWRFDIDKNRGKMPMQTDVDKDILFAFILAALVLAGIMWWI